VFGVGYSQLTTALQTSLPLKILIILGVAKLIATVMSYSSGSSGGIFGPSLFIGGMLGGAVGIGAHYLDGNPQTQAGAFALVGMGAVFAGIVRAPVTSIIIIFEMTNNYSIILPLMIANIASYALATEFFPTPIYDALLLQDGIHLPHEERHALRQISVSAAMTKDLETLRADISVAEAFARLESAPVHFHAYPVLDSGGGLVGICTFNDLKRAISVGKRGSPVRAIATRKLEYVHPNQTLDDALVKMGKRRISQLLVVERGDTSTLLGLITVDDIASELAENSEEDLQVSQIPPMPLETETRV
jgi:CIC family chloride channel protein